MKTIGARVRRTSAVGVGACLGLIATFAAASPPEPAGEMNGGPEEESCCTATAPLHSPWGETDRGEPPRSPAAVAETRSVQSLSAERRAGLLSGAGLGYATAAELNGHPGPKHVLELTDELELSEVQREAAIASYERMHAEAVRLGEALVAAEERLDRRLAERHVEVNELAELTAESARLEGELRFVHLRAHLECDALLTAGQRDRYAGLRGDTGGAKPGAAEHGH